MDILENVLYNDMVCHIDSIIIDNNKLILKFIDNDSNKATVPSCFRIDNIIRANVLLNDILFEYKAIHVCDDTIQILDIDTDITTIESVSIAFEVVPG